MFVFQTSKYDLVTTASLLYAA